MQYDLDPEESCSMSRSHRARKSMTSGRSWISPISWEFRLIAIVVPAVAAVIWSSSQGPESPPQGRVSLVGHTRLVEAVGFSPDGRILASWGFDQTVRLWDAAHLDRELPPEPQILLHPSVVFAAAFSPDGSRLVAAGDGTLIVWSSRPSYHKEVQRSGETFHCLAFSPDGQTLALGAEDGTIRLWEMPAAREKMVLPGQAGTVRSLAFSPDGKLLVSGAHEGRVVLWDAIRCVEQRILIEKGPLPIRAVAFSPDGRTVGVAGAAYKAEEVRLFDAESGEIRTHLVGHPLGTTGLAFSADGRFVATSGVERCVKLWDLATEKVLVTVKADHPCVKSVAFSPDGRWLVYAGGDENVRLLDIRGRTPAPASIPRSGGHEDQRRT